MLLSMITHSYNNQLCLDRQLQMFCGLQPEILHLVEFVYVDDCSDPPAIINFSKVPAPARIRHLKVLDDIPWNMAGCKNLGAVYAKADWLLFFDICHIIEQGGIATLLGNLHALNPNALYFFETTWLVDGVATKVSPHPNTFLINRSRYFQNAGVDEDFVGHYGYEDIYFRVKWEQCGGEVVLLRMNFHDSGELTTNLNRDAERNKSLIEKKVSEDCPRGEGGMLRFSFKEIVGD